VLRSAGEFSGCIKRVLSVGLTELPLAQSVRFSASHPSKVLTFIHKSRNLVSAQCCRNVTVQPAVVGGLAVTSFKISKNKLFCTVLSY
jgi:hypothetical protein